MLFGRREKEQREQETCEHFLVQAQNQSDEQRSKQAAFPISASPALSSMLMWQGLLLLCSQTAP